MTTTSGIAKALLQAQKDFAPATKSESNPFFKSKYVPLDKALEAVVPTLNANGIALIQKTHPSERGVIVETVLIHESGQEISGGSIEVPAEKQTPQGYTSALTYARRVSILSVCGIAPVDDDGEAAEQPYRNNPGEQFTKKP